MTDLLRLLGCLIWEPRLMALGGLRNNKGKKSTHCSKKCKIFEVVNICHNVKQNVFLFDSNACQSWQQELPQALFYPIKVFLNQGQILGILWKFPVPSNLSWRILQINSFTLACSPSNYHNLHFRNTCQHGCNNLHKHLMVFVLKLICITWSPNFLSHSSYFTNKNMSHVHLFYQMLNLCLLLFQFLKINK